MTTIHYRSEDGITGYQEGDILIDDTTGTRTRIVRTGAGLQLEPEPKTRTITLTARAPVKIREDEWPEVARATGDSCGGGDHALHQEAVARRVRECDRYSLRVRRHADGRAIVYGVLDAGWNAPAGGEDRRSGELLDAGADLAAAVRRVGESCRLPDQVIRECVADLPAEEI